MVRHSGGMKPFSVGLDWFAAQFAFSFFLLFFGFFDFGNTLLDACYYLAISIFVILLLWMCLLVLLIDIFIVSLSMFYREYYSRMRACFRLWFVCLTISCFIEASDKYLAEIYYVLKVHPPLYCWPLSTS